jgi:hypothetical protein
MQNLLKYSRLIYGVPVFPNLCGELTFVSLEDIVHSTMQELRRELDGSVRYLNLIGDAKLSLDDIKFYLHQEDGGDIAKLVVDVWIKRDEDLGLHKILAVFFEKSMILQSVEFPRLLREHRE